MHKRIISIIVSIVVVFVFYDFFCECVVSVCLRMENWPVCGNHRCGILIVQ